MSYVVFYKDNTNSFIFLTVILLLNMHIMKSFILSYHQSQFDCMDSERSS